MAIAPDQSTDRQAALIAFAQQKMQRRAELVKFAQSKIAGGAQAEYQKMLSGETPRATYSDKDSIQIAAKSLSQGGTPPLQPAPESTGEKIARLGTQVSGMAGSAVANNIDSILQAGAIEAGPLGMDAYRENPVVSTLADASAKAAQKASAGGVSDVVAQTVGGLGGSLPGFVGAGNVAGSLIGGAGKIPAALRTAGTFGAGSAISAPQGHRGRAAAGGAGAGAAMAPLSPLAALAASKAGPAAGTILDQAIRRVGSAGVSGGAVALEGGSPTDIAVASAMGGILPAEKAGANPRSVVDQAKARVAQSLEPIPSGEVVTADGMTPKPAQTAASAVKGEVSLTDPAGSQTTAVAGQPVVRGAQSSTENPVSLYHGSDFYRPSESRLLSRAGAVGNKGGVGNQEGFEGVFFTKDAKQAEGFTEDSAIRSDEIWELKLPKDARIYDATKNYEQIYQDNPMDISARERAFKQLQKTAEDGGYEGLKFNKNGDGSEEFLIFNPEKYPQSAAGQNSAVAGQPVGKVEVKYKEDPVVGGKYFDAEATSGALPPVPDGQVRLYRGQHPTNQQDAYKPEAFSGHDGGQGGYFTSDISYANDHRRQQGPGAEIVYMDVPQAVADAHSFKNNPDLVANNTLASSNEPSYFFPELRKRLGADPQPVMMSTAVDEALTGLEARSVPEMVAEDKMRKFNQRMAADDRISPEASQAVIDDARSYYEPQSYKNLNEAIAVKSDAELDASIEAGRKRFNLPNQANDLGLNYAEKINRAMAAGEDIAPIVLQAGEDATVFAQLLRQYGEIKNSTPEGMTEIMSRSVESQGRTVPPALKIQLKSLAKADLENRSVARAAEDEWINAPTDANAEKFAAAQKAADSASEAMIKRYQTVAPQKISDMLGKILQGNLMTPTSLVSNLTGNMSFAPFRFSTQTLAALGDAAISAITHRPRTVGQPLLDTWAYVKGTATGTARAKRVIQTGVDPNYTVLQDVRKGFHPMAAWLRVFGRSAQSTSKSAAGKSADVLRNVIEGTAGVSPEIFFRALAATDQVFRGASYDASLNEIGRLRGLRGPDLDRFVKAPFTEDPKNPGKFIRDDTAMATAEERASEKVFQQKNKLASGFSGLLRLAKSVPHVGGYIDALIAKPISPFIYTPTNVLWETLQYFPPLAGSQMLSNAHQGNQRAALLAMGRAATGTAIIGGSMALAKSGLITGDPSEDPKIRSDQFATQRPNTFNVTGSKRLMDGGDPKWQPGDTVVDYNKMGIVGLYMNVAANGRYQQILDSADARMGESKDSNFELLTKIPLQLGGAMFQQSMLKGQLSFMEAMSKGDYDNWLKTYVDAVSSIAIPNTVKAIGNASNPYIADARASNSESAVENILRVKAGLSGSLPPRIDQLGRPIKRTPEGKNAYLHNLLDVLKYQKTPEDKVTYIGHQIWENTLDDRAFPSQPGRRLGIPQSKAILPGLGGLSIDLTDDEFRRYQQITGEERLKRFTPALIGVIEKTGNPYLQLSIVSKVYEDGLEAARKRMFSEVIPSDSIKARAIDQNRMVQSLTQQGGN